MTVQSKQVGEKIPKNVVPRKENLVVTLNRCSGAWINVFFWCMELNWVLLFLPNLMVKGIYIRKKLNKIYFFCQKKNTLQIVRTINAIFEVSSKSG